MIQKVEHFPKVAVSTFSRAIVEKYACMEGVTEIAHFTTSNGDVPIYRLCYNGTDIAFYMSFPGAPAAAILFEEIIAMGAEKLVMFGSCGVLDRSIADGHLIIPTAAIRDEGTSYHYAPSSEEIELQPESVRALTGVMQALQYPFVQGKTWTTDALYRETEDKIEERRRQGCIVVEMECAAMAAIADFRGVRFAQFLYAADNLDAPQWEPRGLTLHGMSNAETYMAAAFECALQLSCI